MTVARFPKLLTASEAAEVANVSESTIRKEVTEGKLPSRRIRRTLRIHVEDLDAYLRAPSAIPVEPSSAKGGSGDGGLEVQS